VITVTQKDRVDSTLHRLEQESLIKQVEHLKLSESKLKRQVNSLKTQLHESTRVMAESQDKYARELEQNRHSEDQAREQRFKFEDVALQNSKLTQQLEEKALSNTVLLNRLEKQKALLEERDLLVEDLRQSVALKISVADDLQSILRQSQEQY